MSKKISFLNKIITLLSLHRTILFRNFKLSFYTTQTISVLTFISFLFFSSAVKSLLSTNKPDENLKLYDGNFYYKETIYIGEETSNTIVKVQNDGASIFTAPEVETKTPSDKRFWEEKTLEVGNQDLLTRMVLDLSKPSFRVSSFHQMPTSTLQFFEVRTNTLKGTFVLQNQLTQIQRLINFLKGNGLVKNGATLSNLVSCTKGNSRVANFKSDFSRNQIFNSSMFFSIGLKTYSYLKKENSLYFLELIGADLLTQFLIFFVANLLVSLPNLVGLWLWLNFLLKEAKNIQTFFVAVLFLLSFSVSLCTKTLLFDYNMIIELVVACLWMYVPLFKNVLEYSFFNSNFLKVIAVFVNPMVGVRFLIDAVVNTAKVGEKFSLFSDEKFYNISVRQITVTMILGTVFNFLVALWVFLHSKNFSLSSLNPTPLVLRLYKLLTKRKKINITKKSDCKRDSTALLSAVSVTKSFSTFGSSFTAVDDVSFDLKKGDKIALLGHNGAGKTTLLSLLTGIEQPSFGELWFENKRYYSCSDLAGCTGYCPQYTTFFPNFTVSENIDLVLSFFGVSSEEAEQRKTTLLHELELGAHAKKTPDKLSGGQRRKLNFLMAIVHSPPIVFLDESSTGVDVLSRGKMVTMLHKYCADSVIVLSTHIIEEAEAFAARVFIMDKGRLVASGSIPEIKQQFGCQGKRLTVHLLQANTPLFDIASFLQTNTAHFKLLRKMATKLSYSIEFVDYKQLSQFYEALAEKKEELRIESFGVTSSTIEEVLNREEFHELKKEDTVQETKNFKTHFENIRKNQVRNTKLVFAFSRLFSVFWNRVRIAMHRLSIVVSLFLVVFYLFYVLSSKNQQGRKNAFGSVNYLEKYKDDVDDTKTKTVLVNDDDIKDQLKNFIKKKYLKFKDRFEFKPFSGSVLTTDKDTNAVFEMMDKEKADIFVNFIDFTGEVEIACADRYMGDLIVLNQIMTDFTIFKNLKNCVDSLPDETKGLFANLYNKFSDQTLQLEMVVVFKTAPTNMMDEERYQLFFVDVFLVFSFMAVLGYLKSEYFSGSKGLKVIYGLPRLGSVFLDVFLDSTVYFFLLWSCLWVLWFTGHNLKNEFLFSELSCSLLLATFAYFFAFYSFSSVLNNATSMQLVSIGIIFCKFFVYFFLVIVNTSVNSTGFYVSWVHYINVLFPLEQVLLLIFVPTTADFIEKLANSFYSPVLVTEHFIVENFGFRFGPSLVFYDINKHVFTTAPLLNCFDPLPKLNLISLSVILVGAICLAVSEYGLFSFLGRKLMAGNISRSIKTKLLNKKLTDESVEKERGLVANKLKDLNTATFQGLLLKDLSKAYTRLLPPDSVVALSALTICVDEGESVGILGANGGGKTTAFKILMKEVVPDAGYVYSQKTEDVTEWFSYTPQYECLNEDQTPTMVLQTFAMIRGFSFSEAHKVAKTVANMVNLGKNRNKLIAYLSGGNKRKVAVGLSLLSSAKVMVMDEPTTGVDVTNSREIWEVIRRLLEGRSLVLASHMMQEVEELTTKVVILVKGVTKAVGTTEFLRNRFGKELEVKVFFADTTKFEAVEDKLKGTLKRLRFNQPNFNSVKFFVDKREMTISALIDFLGSHQAEIGLVDFEVNELSLTDVLENQIAEGAK